MMRKVLLGRWVLWLASLAGGVAPIWMTEVLPTTDGPSHVYNAILSDSIRRGDEVIAARLTCKTGIRNNMATETLLSVFGPSLGWDTAERWHATLIALLTFFSMLAWIASRSGSGLASVAPYAGWLSSSWFSWMGFYDFQLSLAFFALLLVWLSSPRPAVLDAVVLPIVFGSLYVTHLYTFAAATGIGGVLVLGRMDRATLRWPRGIMLAALFAVGLFCIASNRATSSGSTNIASLSQIGRNAIGLVTSDPLIGGTCLGIAAGVLVTLLFVAGALAFWRGAGRGKEEDADRLSVVEWAALALLFGSIVLPDEIGQGSYVPLRTRALGVILLLPFAIAVVSAVWPNMARLLSYLLAFLLLGNAGVVIVTSREVAKEHRHIDAVLEELDLPAGTLVQAHLTPKSRPCFRVRTDLHLAERAFGERRLIAIDNYEAFLDTFAIAWKTRPDGLAIDPEGRVSLVRRDGHGIELIYILHESDRTLTTNDHRLHIEPVADLGGLGIDAVTIRANRD